MERVIAAATDDQAIVRAADIRVLGPFEVFVGGEALNLGGPKQRGLLALLALAGAPGLSVEGVMDGLWGENTPEAARASVYSYVSNLRAVLGGGIERRGQQYTLTVPHTVDSSAAAKAGEEARTLLATKPDSALQLARGALATWRGSPYADLADFPGLQGEIDRLEELRLQLVELRVEASLATGRHAEVIGELVALVRDHPLRERFRMQHMLALYRSGRQVEALRAFQAAREYLADEVGVHPSPELRELELRILQHDEGLLAETGLVTTQRLAFLFSDIESSTRLWDRDPEGMSDALSTHDQITRLAVESTGGTLFKHTGDGALSVFPTAEAAARAAEEIQRQMQAMESGVVGEVRVRMGIDVGDVDIRRGDFFGPPLNRCARITAAAHGGQVLLSSSAVEDLSKGHLTGVQIRQLGPHRLRGLAHPERIGQLVFVGLPADFPALRVDAGGLDLDDRLRIAALRGYELRDQIGTEPLSIVFRAYQPSVGREVALKIVPPEHANHPGFVRRFEVEARLVAQLVHPHIVPLLDFWRDAEGAYLVYELMRGGSLRRWMRGGARDLAATLNVLRQIGLALTYAHAEGRPHRNLRPENVLFDGSGKAYLTGFSIATPFMDPITAGEPPSADSAYRAPEERSGAVADHRSDVYSLGVLIHELLGDSLLSGGRAPTASPTQPGLPAQLAPLIERATAANPDDRFQTVLEFLEALEAVLGVENLTSPDSARVQARNPYKGLRAFDEEDADDFHGRDDLVETLLDAMALHRLVAVVGPSGSGKSSVVHAGLLPRLRQGRLEGSQEWFIARLTPGAHPLEALAAALEALATTPLGDVVGRLGASNDSLTELAGELLHETETQLVVVIDQFEEVFTLTDDASSRRQFIDLLTTAATDPHKRVRVVLTLRADFYDRPLETPSLAQLVARGLVTVIRPTHDELIEAIERPAHTVGLTFEPGLAARISDDVTGQPGGLPLMQYALTTMVERRTSDQLTIRDYEAIGGVTGVIAQRAEALFVALTADQQDVVRHVMLRLVTVDEDSENTRRRVRRHELEGLAAPALTIAMVLDALDANRLVTFGCDPVTRGPTVEVAHEALLRQWNRLRGWIDEERESLILGRRFRLAMAEWMESGRADDFLLTGDRLSPFAEWGARASLSNDEQEFLTGSWEADESVRRATQRRRRVLVAVLLSAAVVASTAAVLTTAASRRADREAARAVTLAEQEAAAHLEADEQRTLAEEQAAIADARTEQATAAEEAAKQAAALATARELAASAIGVGEKDPQLAMLLALEAFKVAPAGAPTPIELSVALRKAVHADRLVQVVPIGSSEAEDPALDYWLGLTNSPDGSVMAVQMTAGDTVNSLTVLDTKTLEKKWTQEGRAFTFLAFSPDAKWMLTSRNDDHASPDEPSALEVIDVETGAVSVTIPFDCNVGLWRGDWSPDGSLVAFWLSPCESPGSSEVLILETETWTPVHSIPIIETFMNVAFAREPSANRLLVMDWTADPNARIFDTATFELVAAFDYHVGAISPDGRTFFGADFIGESPTLFDVETGATIDKLAGLDGLPATEGAVFSPDGSLVLVPSEGSELPIWDVATGQLAYSLPAGQYASATFGATSDQLYTSATDGSIYVWELSRAGFGELYAGEAGTHVGQLGISVSGSLGAVWMTDASGVQTVQAFDGLTGELKETFEGGPVGLWPASVGGKGVMLVTGDYDNVGPLQWWSPSTGEIRDLAGCWAGDDGTCPGGGEPIAHMGLSTSLDGSEAGLLSPDWTFRVWNEDGQEEHEALALKLGDEPTFGNLPLLMGFSDEWIVVRVGWGEYLAFSRTTGEVLTRFNVPNHIWLRFDTSGAVGVGFGFGSDVSVVRTSDWSSTPLTSDLGEGLVRSVALSPLGDRVALGVMDGYIRIFEISTGDLLDRIPMDQVLALHWLDETHVVAGSDSGAWMVLTLDHDELQTIARERLSRAFTADECRTYRIESCDTN